MPSTGPYYPHGFQEQFFGALETTFDTDTKPAAAEGISITESDFTPENDLIMSAEKIGTRMVPDIFKGVRRVKGTVGFYIKPAAAGVVPNGAAILEAALSTKTIVGATSVTYANRDTSIVNTLRLSRGIGNGLMETVYGAVIEQLHFDIKAGEQPKVTAQFSGARLARAKTSVLTAAATIGTGTCAVAAGEGMRFEKGTTIKFLKVGGTSEDNSGLGYLVTSDGADTVTFTPVAVSTAAIGDEIVAFTPTPTYVGTAVTAVSHDVSLGGTSINFVDAKLTLKTGLVVRTEAQADRPTGALAGETLVEGEINAFMQEQQLGNISYSHWSKAFQTLVIRAGLSTAAQHLKLNMANAMVECTPIKVPGDAASMVNLKFRAKSAFSIILD